MTIRQLARELDIKPQSLQKNIRRWKDNEAKQNIFKRANIEPEFAPVSLDVEFSNDFAESIRKEYRRSNNGKAHPKPAPGSQSQPPAAKASPRQPKPAPKSDLSPSKVATAIAAWIIISADATSCSWIAYNSYEGNFQWPAALIFAGVGLAIGYSAFRNIMDYEGYDAGNYAWGFGLFQALIHLCAMQSFDYFHEGLSFGMGKIVIAIALPLASSGLAITFKKK